MKRLTLPEIERLEACDRNCSEAPWQAFVSDDSEYGTYAVQNYKGQEIITWGGFDGVRAPEAASKATRRAHVRMISFVRNILPRIAHQLRADDARIKQLEDTLEAPSPVHRAEELEKWLAMWLSWSRQSHIREADVATTQSLAGLQQKTRALLDSKEGQ